jgi:chemotaxis protein CheX
MSDPKESTKKTIVDFGRNPMELTSGENYATLKFVGDLTVELLKEFDRKLGPKFEEFSNDLILDLTECGNINKAWARSLMGVAMNVKKSGHRLKVASGNPIHRTYFQEQGVAANFMMFHDVSTAASELAAKRSAKLDVNFINPFLEGAVEILKKAAGTSSKPGSPGSREPSAPLDGEISGQISIQTNSFKGSVILSFPEATYLKIVSNMLGESHEAITPENRDAAAEITNMIFGHAKRILNEKGYQLQMARPTVLIGKNPTSLPAGSGPRIAVPFESDAGPFSIEIRIQST